MKTKYQLTNLIALFYIIIFSQTVNAAPLLTIDTIVSDYSSSLCMECHEDVAENLLMSNHAYSIINPRVITALRNETKSSKPAGESIKGCLKCHAPITENAPDELLGKIATLVIIADNKHTALKDAALKELSKLSINCLVCHMIKGMPEGKVTPKVIYGPGWDEHEHSHMDEYGFDTLKSEYFMTSGFCKNCHSGNLSSHKNYNKHYTNSNNTCHQCHMLNHKFAIALPFGKVE